MTNEKDYSFGSLRLKRDTLELLKDIKDAFDVSYGHKFTMDEFIRQMAASLEAGDPGVWDIYCTMKTQREELAAKVEEAKRLRGQENKKD